MVTVSRPINGISLNEHEFLLDEKGEVMKFDSLTAASDFLKGMGMTGEEIYYLTFNEEEEVSVEAK